MFYTYYQNNSGGYIHDNVDVGRHVVIEGDTLEDIHNKAKIIFEPYMDFCTCCGERWEDLYYEDENDLEAFPSILNKEDSYWEGSSIIVYYKNSDVKHFKHK